MIGFIKKDLCTLKGSFKIYAVIFVIYIIMAFQGEMNISGLPTFFSSVLILTSFSYDSYNNWDSYAVCLPNGRKNAVRAKYLANIVLCLIVSVILTIISSIISYMTTNTVVIGDIVKPIIIVNFVTFLFQAIMFPIIYKLGIEKARVIIFLVIMLIALMGGAFLKYVNFNYLGNAYNILKEYWLILVISSSFIILFISYIISQRIYQKKEF